MYNLDVLKVRKPFGYLLLMNSKTKSIPYWMEKNEEDITMNKSELINALAEKTEFTKKDAEKSLNAFIEVINENLAKGEKIQLVGFGTFEVKDRPARVARNPRTGEEIKIAASKAPTFKAGKALKDKVNTPAKKKGKK